MPLVNSYVTLEDEKDYLAIPPSSTANDQKIINALNSASRSVDAYCQRRFWLDPTPVARTFVPQQGLLDLDLNQDDPLGSEIGNSAVTVATDPGGTGVYSQVWASSDFQLLPYNAPYAFGEARPWNALRAVGGKTFPWLVNTWLTHLNRVQITARWGWPSVPENVRQATQIKAARLFSRKDSPQGVAGFGEFGVIRITQKDDPDVCILLETYRRLPVLVA